MPSNRESGKHMRSTMALNSQTLRWRKGSVLKSSGCSSRDLGLAPSSHNSSSRGSGALFWPLWVLHTQDNILVDTLKDKQKQPLKRTRHFTDKCTPPYFFLYHSLSSQDIGSSQIPDAKMHGKWMHIKIIFVLTRVTGFVI